MEKTFKVTNSTADEINKKRQEFSEDKNKKQKKKRNKKKKKKKNKKRTRKRRVHRILNYKYAIIIFQDAFFSPGLSTQRETIRTHYMYGVFLVINLIGSRIVSTIVP